MSLARPIRFSSMQLARSLIASSLLVMAMAAHGFEWLDDSNRVISEAVKNGASETWFLPPKPTKEQEADAQAIAGRGLEILRESHQSIVGAYPVNKAPDAAETYIFVSFAIPRAELKRIADEANATGAVLVFRGVPKGGKLTDIGLGMSKLMGGAEKAPTVILDPTLFQRFRILDVPAVALPLQGTDRYATASGIVNLEWMKRKTATPSQLASLHLGKFGQTWEVLEPDFIEEMKRRMLALDWSGMKEKAIGRFWQNQKTYDLPQARKDSRRSFDPTLVVTKNIYNSDGQLVLAAGTAMNPLKQMPLTKRYIVFDGRYKKQIEIANRLKQEAWAQGRGTSLIMANFTSDMGWEGFEALHNHFKSPVFLLNDQIRSRFMLKNLPAMVEADGTNLVVTEYAVTQK